MEENKLKINIPEGYEIDKEKSTFEEIIFKKVEDPLAKLPKTWEEYCKRTKGYTSYYGDNSLKSYITSLFSEAYNEFSTEERLKQYIALGKLLQLRDYWVGGWKPNLPINPVFAVKNTTVVNLIRITLPLTFPTKEMAEEFKDCFSDLIKQAFPLV